MKIRMLKNTRGSDDHLGRSVRTYYKDEELEASEDWQRDLYAVFVQTHRAKEIKVLTPGVEIETPESAAPTETKAKRSRRKRQAPPKKISPSTPWFTLRSWVAELTGKVPENKPEALEALQKAGRLSE